MVKLPVLMLITRNMPPLRGGMERLNAQMASAFAADHRVTVIAPKGSRIDSHASLRIRCCPLPGTAAFLIWAFVASAILAAFYRPRWIVGGSGLVAPIVLFASVISGARRAVYLHGLDIVVKNRVYQSIWLPAIRRMYLCIVNSRNTRALAIGAGVNCAQIQIVMPGVTMPDVRERDIATLEANLFRAEHGLGTSPIILSVGRLTRRKGLVEFIEHAMGPILAARSDARLVVIGDDAPDALHASGISGQALIESAARRAGVEAAVHLLGPVPEAVLNAAFAAAHVHVFPGIDIPGDVEGFGMVAIEAAAHGVPTVAFDVGGVADAIEDPTSGSLIPSGDYPFFVRQVLQYLDKPGAATHQSCRGFAERFVWPRFYAGIRGAIAPGHAS